MAGHRVGGGEPLGERERSVAEERFDELDKRRLRSDFTSQGLHHRAARQR
jgi:hypothetical protein